MLSPEQVRQGRDMLYEAVTAAGRDPKSIEIVAAPVPTEPEGLNAFEEAGADTGVIFLVPSEERQMLAELEDIAQKLLT